MRAVGCVVLVLAAACTDDSHSTAAPARTRSAAPVLPPSSSANASRSNTSAPGRPATAVAPDSLVTDLTWVSTRTGWALAGVPCSRGLCAEIAHTVDGGQHWMRMPAPTAYLTTTNSWVDCDRLPCVTGIRFATPTVGYLFGPALFMTTDGGRIWRRQPGEPTEVLEAAGGNVVRVTYRGTGCPGPCDRRIEVAAVGGTAWRTVSTPELVAGRSARAQLVRHGPGLVYAVIYGNLAAGVGSQQALILRSSNGGDTWTARGDPCGTGRAAVDLAAAGDGFVAVLCHPREGVSAAAPATVVTSRDFGHSFGSPHAVPGQADLVAAASTRNVVVTTGPVGGEGPFAFTLAVSADGGLHWRAAVRDPEQISASSPGSAFLGFQSSTVGRWVGFPRTIWTTADGAAHWYPRAFS